ncbi:chemotaxis protein CheA [Microvirga guangxiensis]|uniref:Chemotaxis protein CheA n=1 Tax=Microvirga guangxiensis TaxID=549386 RepID=A0A1G5BN41_9HYPH|nr:chemotaxis protein CheA [Microvirga guangxiensis]SCX91424.1 two-component system, chemotaxis family, sensor kinase CheA [Microvirga guangxiensis]
MDDLLQHFIVEARELIQQATDDLLALERDPNAVVPMDGAFRAVHTLKGSVGLFDFAPMGLALHAAEDVLGALKEGRVRAEADVIDTLLDCIGQAERWVAEIERTGLLPPDAAEEGYRLARVLRSHADENSAPAAAAGSPVDLGWVKDLIAQSPDAAAQAKSLVAIVYTPRSDCFFSGDDPVALLRSIPNLVSVRISNREPWPPVSEIDPFACNLRIEALSSAALDAIRAIFRFVPDQVTIHEVPCSASDRAATGAAGPLEEAAGGARGRTLRVDAVRIDHLADLVGEMVVAKNALAHLSGQIRDRLEHKDLAQALLTSQASISRIVAELHRAVMDVRMMPMRDIFRRFPRAVRDIAGALGKAVDFSMEGEDVEADKSVVEGLFEPLLHVLRNAIDHGAEPEEARLKAGKPGRVKVTLRARREGDRVAVEIEDDGRGIDPAAVRRVAGEQRVTSADELERMSDAEIINLIFAPGFSTASEVTDLSGRGVGMDAVRSAVERMGGQVSVQSLLGHGTTIRLSLPLTIVMARVMAVRIGQELYGIPLDGVIETTIVPRSRVIPVGDAEAFVLRDRTIPLIRLSDLLEISRSLELRSSMKVVVMALDDGPVGIAVDSFAERMDVLMRPMSGILSGMPGVMGTTLLGDGNVLMILDIPELIG